MTKPHNSPTGPPPRFTLAGLLELIAGIALFLGLVIELGWLGFFLAGIAGTVVLAADGMIFAPDREQAWQSVRLGCLLCFALSLVGICSTGVLFDAGEPTRRGVCINNLRQIALALHGYHDVHGHFPPPYIADANGKPMHSWRVLVLPYMELQHIYGAYNFDEPWDGPNNSKLASQIPSDTFRCPSDPDLPANMTSYFYVVGPGRHKLGRDHLDLRDFHDGLSIMLVESSTARVNWLEPRDLTIDEVIGGIDDHAPRAASSHHPGSEGAIWYRKSAFHVALHDASILPLPNDIDAEALRALLTVDGGEQINVSRYKATWRLRPEFVSLVSLTLAFVLLAIIRRVQIARRTLDRTSG